MDDHELLRRYVGDGSEDAFRELVERHGGLVYGVALRQLRRPHQADEVAHAVFAALAKKAGSLSSSTVLAGWLFRATRFAAAKLQRDEERRARREQEAALIMNSHVNSGAETDWEQIVPWLDAELEALGDKDRSAVLLRFFEDRSFKEVGETLGASEDAAKMRVSRALDRLRERFLKRGVMLSATALAGAFGSSALAATTTAPPGLVTSVTKACLAKTASNALGEAVALKLEWWKWKPFVIGASAVVALGIALLGGMRALNPPPPPAQKTPAWPVQR